MPAINMLVKFSLVALFTRAWIEINDKKLKELKRYVALFTRAWIEIEFDGQRGIEALSPSSRGRGLKYR